MTRTRYKIYDTIYPHCLTCTVVGWMPVFTRPKTTDVVLDSLRFLQEKDRLTLFGYVLLENHLHLIAAAEELSKEIGDFKSFTARKVIDYLKKHRVKMFLDQLKYYKVRHKIDQEYQLWQEGSPVRAEALRSFSSCLSRVSSSLTAPRTCVRPWIAPPTSFSIDSSQSLRSSSLRGARLPTNHTW